MKLLLSFLLAVSALHAANVRPPIPDYITMKRTQSMAPIFTGDEVLNVHHVLFSDVGVGDIILRSTVWDWRADWTVHVIIGRDWLNRGWITKGINNAHADMGFVTEATYGGVVLPSGA